MWVVPRYLMEWKTIWFILTGQEHRVHEHCKLVLAGGGNGVQSAMQLDWNPPFRRAPTHPAVQFSARTPGYFEARQRAADIHKEYGLRWCAVWGCDLQDIYPDLNERWQAFVEWVEWLKTNPHVDPVAANEPWNNGWRGATDPDLKQYGAYLRDQLRDGRTFCIGDPKDETDKAGEPLRGEIIELLRVGGPQSYFAVHPVRKGELPRHGGEPRYARWLDHMHGTIINQAEHAQGALGWPHLPARRINESNSTSPFFEEDYRENRPLALVVGQILGAMMGGYTQMYRSEEAPNFGDGWTPPGWLEARVASIIPGSPDYYYENVNGPHSHIHDFEGFGKSPGTTFPEGKVRILSNGAHQFSLAYGAPGRIIWKNGARVDLVIFEGKPAQWEEKERDAEGRETNRIFAVGELWESRR